VVCATHEEIDRVTETIRSLRKQAGKLGRSVEIGRDVSLSWTTAQKSDTRNFRPGQFLVFHRAVKGITKNETVEVAQVLDHRVMVRNARGELQTITARQAKSFDVCERRVLEIAAGDRLLITANRREPGFRATNGEIVTVERVDQKGQVHLRDGRVLPPSFRQFAHGYAVTAHRSQGKSVDSVIISGDGMRRELFYVAATRGKERVVVITSDKEVLRESVARSDTRQSATELARKARPGLLQGAHRGLAAARILASRAARYVSQIGRRHTLQEDLRHEPRVERTYDHDIER
jgi:ATP-dependent exoDNAse (exonuclease V) alpha subunit